MYPFNPRRNQTHHHSHDYRHERRHWRDTNIRPFPVDDIYTPTPRDPGYDSDTSSSSASMPAVHELHRRHHPRCTSLNRGRCANCDGLCPSDSPQQPYDRYVCFKDPTSSHAHHPCRCHRSSNDTNHTHTHSHEPRQHIHYHRHYHTESSSPTPTPLCAERRIHTHHHDPRRTHRSQYQCIRCCSASTSGCDSSWVCDRCRGLNGRTVYGPSVPVIMRVPRGCMGR